MALADKRAKSAKMAKDLIARGFPHGKRQTSPHAHAGTIPGVTSKNSDATNKWINTPGSSKYQRLMASRYTSNR